MKYGYVNKDELMHYGVKGMKWHKRKKKIKIGFEEAREANYKNLVSQKWIDNHVNASYNNSGEWYQYRNKGKALENRAIAARKKYERTLLGRLGIHPVTVERGEIAVKKLLRKSLGENDYLRKKMKYRNSM